MSRAFLLRTTFLAMASVAALALATSGCKHTPEAEETASAKPPVNDLPEVQPVQGSSPQASAAPSPSTSTPTESASSAREPCNPGGAQARYADANNDGKVTKEEAQADPNLVAVFDQYDANHDGVLDHDEFQKIVDDAQQKHPDRAEFARAEASEPCPDQGKKDESQPGT